MGIKHRKSIADKLISSSHGYKLGAKIWFEKSKIRLNQKLIKKQKFINYVVKL